MTPTEMMPKTCEAYVVERCKYLEERCDQLIKETERLDAKSAEMQDVINYFGNIARIRTNEYIGEKYISIENTYEGTDEYDLLEKYLFPDGNK